MATAFQSSAFQNTAFQITGGAVVVPDTHDGFGATPDQYRRYRERLQALSDASERFQQSKYIPKEEISDQIEALEELDIEVKSQVLESSTQADALQMQQFYNGLHAKLVAEITRAQALYRQFQDEEDDIAAVLMSGLL